MGESPFNHPFDPYEIQLEFMRTLYGLLTGPGKVGIFESPTGTGKTLSLMCPSVTWLRNSDKIRLQQRIDNLEKLKGPPFIKAAAKKKLYQEFQEQGEALRILIERSQHRIMNRQTKKKRLTSSAPTVGKADSEYLLQDPIVDENTDILLKQALQEDDPIMDRLTTPRKIFFTSRTHSQLGQFVNALKSLKIEAAWSDTKQPMKHATLGSRKQLCNNPDVSKSGSIKYINNQCSELRKKQACSYYKNNQQQLTQEIVTNVMDIEDLYKAGETSHSCSYYAAREAVKYSEVVTLPYQLLIDSNTRRALGIDIRDSLVIIDEAHNIFDAISSLNSSSISRQDVESALVALRLYQDRVGRKLSTYNSTRLSQTIMVVESLANFFGEAAKLPADKTHPGSSVLVADLFNGKNVEMINLWELKDWFETSKLVFKLDNYIVSENGGAAENKGHHSPPARTLVLGRVVDFIAWASNPSQEGKVFFDKIGDSLGVRFLSLDPSYAFEELVNQAAKVVLAGGTMEPISDYTDNLLPHIPSSQLVTFSCGHIVPASHIMVRVLEKFEFTFSTRGDRSMIERLGCEIEKLSAVIPAGMVVFLPSYSYLDKVLDIWQSCQIYGKVARNKKIFTEDRKRSAENTLQGYANQIKEGSGAILFAVVGGKLSEGINFSDDLARGVIMVGLPFPNAFSAEMVAKKEFIEARELNKGKSALEAAQVAREQYENLSMRAVNQSVGRAIRHIKDYSSIYLVDRRYQHPRIKSKLSGWLRDAVVTSPEYIEDTREFFLKKQC